MASTTAPLSAQTARELLHAHGWIAARNESFRHLPPPALSTWLDAAQTNDTPPSPGNGWTLQPWGTQQPMGEPGAQWLDSQDSTQRAALFADLTAPAASDAAPFAWAHRALCQGGLRLRVPATAQTTWLQLQHAAQSVVEAPLLVLDVPDGAHCVLLETHTRGTVPTNTGLSQNLQVQVQLGKGAVLQHLRLVSPGAHDQLAHQVQVQLGPDARYQQALVATGGRYHLQRTAVSLAGAHANAHVGGLLLAADNKLEQQVHTTHQAPHTRSATEALVLAGGKAHAVVNAHTHIAPGADEANVYQRLSGIPMGGQPRLVLRPHLEIEHDNVQAAHGATWGALPEDALFYARQRGLDEASARTLIVHGMASALLERCFGQGADLLAAIAQDGQLTNFLATHLATLTENHHG